jgi:hypothetical protein
MSGYVTGTGKTVNNGIWLQYRGKNCGEMRLVQILWREVRVYRGDQAKLEDVELDTTAGKYRSTTDTDKPVYKIDTPKKSVLYGGQKGCISGQLTYILDAPSDLAKWIYEKYYANDAAVTRIVSVGHYDWYVYNQGNAVYHVSWTSTANWEKGKPSSDPVIDVTGGGANDGPNQRQIDALRAHNPEYDKDLTHVIK